MLNRMVMATTGILAASLLAVGCSTNVVVEGEFPEPVNRPLPVSATLVLDEDFRTHSHEVEEPRKVSFAIGEAQSALFRQVSTGLFERITEVDGMPGSGEAGTELILAPRIEEIQLATPHDTQLNVFEVWLKYNIRVFSGTGDPIADWILTSYGKTPTRFLKSDEEALNQAALVALRDAGARLIIELPRKPEVQDWLRQQAVNRQPAPEQVP